MKILVFLAMGVFGWIFLMENDQEMVNIILPGFGRIGPFSIGVIVLGAVLFGIVFCLVAGGMLRIFSRLRKGASRPPGEGAGGPSGGRHDDH